jgi:hypothetical protein
MDSTARSTWAREDPEVYHRPKGEHWNRQGHWNGDALVQDAPFEALMLKLGPLWER